MLRLYIRLANVTKMRVHVFPSPETSRVFWNNLSCPVPEAGAYMVSFPVLILVLVLVPIPAPAMGNPWPATAFVVCLSNKKIRSATHNMQKSTHTGHNTLRCNVTAAPFDT